jgi:hypothetical protein
LALAYYHPAEPQLAGTGRNYIPLILARPACEGRAGSAGGGEDGHGCIA